MGETVRRTVVVSAVNIRKGGTLTILRDCLRHLSGRSGEYRIVALVHSRALCDFPGIEYIEMPRCIRNWARRLWAEYVTMHRISREIAGQDGGRKVWLWLSLHDTTPRVEAEHQEVYCHTSFPFMKVKLRDFFMDPKIVLFTLFTKWAYRINIHKNDSIIVQQNWFADAMSEMLGVPRPKFRVIPPGAADIHVSSSKPCSQNDAPVFFYPSTPDCHKNFETLCRAAALLESEMGEGRFKVIITVSGDENRYARFLYRRWGLVDSMDFHGFMSKEELFRTYSSADCLVFPSRIESWGLPISEFKAANRCSPMLLADLPYAHETAGTDGGRVVRYFSPEDFRQLALLMRDVMEREL
ncbi:MAG: glycosyltransferase family 4 protein [Bacteroidales bacterium]|nr:glycosyltransferase family 4 protein [Bacteroidales bacterium]